MPKRRPDACHPPARNKWGTTSFPLATRVLCPPVVVPSPAVYNETAFLRAFGVVIANSVYLSAAQCFALMPLASTMGRTGNDNGCNLDYDAELGAVVITAPLRMM